MSVPRSVRFADEVVRRLDRYVRSHPGSSASSVTNLFVDEAIRAEEHPGIMFRPGPTGRRAAVAGGPDVWEVITTLHTVRSAEPDLEGDPLVTAVAEALGQTERTVRVATRYYAAYRSCGWPRLPSPTCSTTSIRGPSPTTSPCPRTVAASSCSTEGSW